MRGNEDAALPPPLLSGCILKFAQKCITSEYNFEKKILGKGTPLRRTPLPTFPPPYSKILAPPLACFAKLPTAQLWCSGSSPDGAGGGKAITLKSSCGYQQAHIHVSVCPRHWPVYHHIYPPGPFPQPSMFTAHPDLIRNNRHTHAVAITHAARRPLAIYHCKVQLHQTERRPLYVKPAMSGL